MNKLDFFEIISTTSNISNPKILDLGFGDLSSAICCFKKRQILNNNSLYYFAVDKKSDYKVFQHYPEDYLGEEFEIDTTTWSNQFNNTICSNEIAEKAIYVINETDFKKFFKLTFKTCVTTYLKNLKNEKFDFILLSDILHFLSPTIAQDVFERCLSLLNKNGKIYCSVLSSKSNYETGRNLYDYNRYLKMKDMVKVIDVSEKDQLHYQFIGESKFL